MGYLERCTCRYRRPECGLIDGCTDRNAKFSTVVQSPAHVVAGRLRDPLQDKEDACATPMRLDRVAPRGPPPFADETDYATVLLPQGSSSQTRSTVRTRPHTTDALGCQLHMRVSRRWKNAVPSLPDWSAYSGGRPRAHESSLQHVENAHTDSSCLDVSLRPVDTHPLSHPVQHEELCLYLLIK